MNYQLSQFLHYFTMPFFQAQTQIHETTFLVLLVKEHIDNCFTLNLRTFWWV